MALILIIGISDVVRFGPIWSDLVIRVTPSTNRYSWPYSTNKAGSRH